MEQKKLLLVWHGFNEPAMGVVGGETDEHLVITLNRKPIWGNIAEHLAQLKTILADAYDINLPDMHREILEKQIAELEEGVKELKSMDQKYTMRVVVELSHLHIYKDAFFQLKRIKDYVEKDGQLTLKNDLSFNQTKVLINEGLKLKV